MDKFYSVKDLEKLLNKSRTQALRFAQSQNWEVVKKLDGKTYKNFYLAKQVDKIFQEEVPAETKKETSLVRTVAKKEINAVDELPSWNQDTAWARYILCTKLQEEYDKLKGFKKQEIIENFVKDIGSNYPQQMEVVKKVSVPTLRRWYAAYIKNPENPLALSSGHGANKGLRRVDEEVLKDVRNLYLSKNKVSISFVYERLFMKYGKEVITYGTLRNYIKKDLHNILVDNSRMGAKEFKDTHMPYIERDFSTLKANDLWVSDGHDIECFCYHPYKKNSKGGKLISSPKIVVWLDMKTRLLVGWTLSWTETTESVAIALKDAIAKYGMPKKLYTDNGKAYKSKVLKGDDSLRLDGIYKTLGLNVTHAIPYNAQAKPIERWFLDFKNDFAKSSLTYKGGHILERKEELKLILKDEKLKSKILEASELEEYIREWIDFKNDAYYKIRRKMTGRAHRGDSMENKSPLELFNKELPKENREMVPEEKLRLLFLYEDNRTVGQNGVTFFDNTYVHEKLFEHLGERVKIKYDPHNLSFFYVYLDTGEFLCKAEKLRKAGFNDIDDIKEHKSRIKKVRKLKNNIMKLMEEERETTGIIEYDESRSYDVEVIDYKEVEETNKNRICIGDGLYVEI